MGFNTHWASVPSVALPGGDQRVFTLRCSKDQADVADAACFAETKPRAVETNSRRALWVVRQVVSELCVVLCHARACTGVEKRIAVSQVVT